MTMTFEQELEQLINRHSLESASNTPDFILAKFARSCLTAFAEASNRREQWYGTRHEPGQPRRECPVTTRDGARCVHELGHGGDHLFRTGACSFCGGGGVVNAVEGGQAPCPKCSPAVPSPPKPEAEEDTSAAEKCELIEKFLLQEGYSKEARRKDETMEVEAQGLVLRLGLNRMTLSELREFMCETEFMRETEPAPAPPAKSRSARSAEIRSELSQLNPGALLATGLDDALIGIGRQFSRYLAVYSVDACLRIFQSRGMTREQALEHFEFNVVGSWVGEGTPVFLDSRPEAEDR